MLLCITRFPSHSRYGPLDFPPVIVPRRVWLFSPVPHYLFPPSVFSQCDSLLLCHLVLVSSVFSAQALFSCDLLNILSTPPLFIRLTFLYLCPDCYCLPAFLAIASRQLFDSTGLSSRVMPLSPTPVCASVTLTVWSWMIRRTRQQGDSGMKLDNTWIPSLALRPKAMEKNINAGLAYLAGSSVVLVWREKQCDSDHALIVDHLSWEPTLP